MRKQLNNFWTIAVLVFVFALTLTTLEASEHIRKSEVQTEQNLQEEFIQLVNNSIYVDTVTAIGVEEGVVRYMGIVSGIKYEAEFNFTDNSINAIVISDNKSVANVVNLAVGLILNKLTNG